MTNSNSGKISRKIAAHCIRDIIEFFDMNVLIQIYDKCDKL